MSQEYPRMVHKADERKLVHNKAEKDAAIEDGFVLSRSDLPDEDDDDPAAEPKKKRGRKPKAE